ncbi:MAG: hypothetical protein HYV40_06010 [Candidatus Levybacteria bacterium]|nr:hypothetical protein [Candidatus Levybacteria bacterium]
MHDLGQRIEAHPPINEEGVPEEPSLQDYYSISIFNTPELTQRLQRIMPILRVVDQLGGSLQERRVLLSGMFWAAGDEENFAEIGLSNEDFQRNIATFSDAQSPNQPTIEDRYNQFYTASYAEKRRLTRELFLAGWTGKRIEQWLNLSPSFILDTRKALENEGLLEKKAENKGKFGRAA